MVIFDQLRISDDGKRMYISIHVSTATYFNDIYLDRLTIMTQDKVMETDPSIPASDYVYTTEFEGQQKQAELVLTASDFIRSWEEDPKKMMFKTEDLSKTLFFVYVKVKGVPDPCTPCGMDEEITIGVTFDTNMLHQKVMQYTNELVKDCTIPQGFTDFILLWQAFNSAVETEHFVPAIKYWRMLFDLVDDGPMGKAKGCGCHG